MRWEEGGREAEVEMEGREWAEKGAWMGEETEKAGRGDGQKREESLPLFAHNATSADSAFFFSQLTKLRKGNVP